LKKKDSLLPITVIKNRRDINNIKRDRLLGLGVNGDFVVRSLVGWIDQVRSLVGSVDEVRSPIDFKFNQRSLKLDL